MMESSGFPVLEVCVDSIDSAVNAVEGGGSRLELCQALSEGGLTPSVGLLTSVKKLVNIPVFVLIRPRRGDFLYAAAEVDAMATDVEALSAAGADGFVFGALGADGSVDAGACRRLLAAARGAPCTFHRAFDVSGGDPGAVYDVVAELGFSRLLTSGRAATAVAGVDVLRSLAARRSSKNKCVVMPGCGIGPESVGEVVKRTGCVEVHASCKAPAKSKMEFRNELCSMGGGGDDEYERSVTSADVVRKVVAEMRLALVK